MWAFDVFPNEVRTEFAEYADEDSVRADADVMTRRGEGRIVQFCVSDRALAAECLRVGAGVISGWVAVWCGRGDLNP